MNKEFVYIDNNAIISDENGTLNEIRPYSDNLNEILVLENEKETLENKNIKLEKDKTKAQKRKVKYSKQYLLFGLTCTALSLPVILKLFGLDFALFIASRELMVLEGVFVGTGLMIFGGSYISDIRRNKEMDRIIEESTKEYMHNCKNIKLIDNKINQLESDKTISNNEYNDYDVIDVNTNKVVKSLILKK